jgi:nitrogen regulatory protein P-II 1
MKHIKAILQLEKLADVRAGLEKTKCYRGIIITDVMGQGIQKGIVQAWRGEKFQTDLIPKVEIDLIVKDEDVSEIIDIIYKNAHTGEIGDGKIFIYNVEEAIRIRTGEKGNNALE